MVGGTPLILAAVALEALLPEALRSWLVPVVHQLQTAVLPILYAGNSVECPVCEGRFRGFLPYHGRPGVLCPRCRSLERHRVLWLYLQRETSLLTEPLRTLHIAPEPGIQARLRALPELNYVSADLDPRSPAMVEADITALPWPADSFDFVLCNHVLEHVPDDRAAMREIVRVLAPAGEAILQHPISESRERTFEDPCVVTPRERQQAFGQRDHVRIYGHDFFDRLRDSGLKVTVIDYMATLDAETVRRYGIADEPIFHARPLA